MRASGYSVPSHHLGSYASKGDGTPVPFSLGRGGDASFPLSSGPTQTPAEKRREEEGAGLESRW